MVLELVRFEVAGPLLDDVLGEFQHVFGNLHIFNLVRILGCVAHFVGIAQQHPHQALVEGLECDDMFTVGQDHAGECDLVERADRLADGFLFWLRPELGLINRFAFAATRFRYRWTILSPETPVIRLAVASRAASIFSRTISSASRRAPLPPRISFIMRSATTPFASAASRNKDVNIRRSVRRGLKGETLYISQRLSVLL
jgi:hypothetical protein